MHDARVVRTPRNRHMQALFTLLRTTFVPARCTAPPGPCHLPPSLSPVPRVMSRLSQGRHLMARKPSITIWFGG